MRVSAVNINNYKFSSPLKNRSFSGGVRDVFESSKDDSVSEKETFGEKYSQKKTNFWLCMPVPTRRHIKAMWNDPIAYFYDADRDKIGKVINKELIKVLDLQPRKGNKTKKADLKKVEFDDGSVVYYIQKGIEKLGYIDVDYSDDGIAFVDYASTIVGRDDYKNLFFTLIQTMVEDYMKKFAKLPEIQAEAVDMGEIKFSRSALYKFYGAESKVVHYGKDEGFGYKRIIYVEPERLLRILTKIQDSPRRKFIMESTSSILDEIRPNYYK